MVNSVYFWDWAENTLIPGLFEHEWYNGKIHNRTGFIEDRESMRMGLVRFRQVRVQNGKLWHVYYMFWLHTMEY